ncbi:MAG TPA: DUF3795 domain-containing protein [Patescibacteria group bacterium]|nr:DUF3795 domain-containing protein [Patescibacteria group bacterium]
MSDFNLVGKCGLYCGACTIYRAERDNQDWRSELASQFNCSSEQVRCNGCGSLTNECWGSGCKIVMCINSKGHKFCFECNEYKNNNCDKFSKVANRYAERSKIDLRANLMMIQNGETESWLEESKNRFSCRICGRPVVAGSKTCHHCNKDMI